MDFNAIFKSVQGRAATESTKSSNNNKDLTMSFVPGNEYLLRCVPYKNKDGEYKYFCRVATYAWRDMSGRWWNVTSPYSIGEKCPIMQFWNSYKEQHTSGEMERLKSILQFRNVTYFNALIVNDPVNPNNNKQIKIINGGKELARIVSDAVDGKLDEEYSRRAADALGKDAQVSLGPNIFNLTNSGWNMLVKPLKGNPAISYKTSSFTKNKSKLDLSEEEQEKYVNNAYDLEDHFLSSIKSYEETAEIFKKHFVDAGVLDDGYSSSHNGSQSSNSLEDDDFESMLNGMPEANDTKAPSSQEDDLGDAFEDNIPF